MRRIFLCLGILLAWSGPLALAVPQQVPESMAKPFEYDAKQALNIQITSVSTRDGCKRYDLTYVSPHGGRVPAYLIVPDGKGPFAGIVFGHWGNGNRTEFLPEAELYARVGVVSILPAYPWTRPTPWYRGLNNVADHDLQAYVQAVVDLRRAFDLLLARPDIDPKRVAYVGHSYGAQWGAILTAVDRRMKTSILVGGVPGAFVALERNDPAMEPYLTGEARKRVDQYFAGIQSVDAIRYIGYTAPIPILFQFARFEQYEGEQHMKRYFEAAGEPKEQKWYDTGHDLNDLDVTLDRSIWLKDRIGIRSIAPLLERKLKR
jgi:dienelactone hydrolase